MVCSSSLKDLMASALGAWGGDQESTVASVACGRLC